MRTNIEPDGALFPEARRVAPPTTVEAVLQDDPRRVLRAEARRRALEDLRGLGWDGSLDDRRAARR